MQPLTLELPTMYGDHHVLEVRQILAGLPGVAAETLKVSAARQRVELEYDPAQSAPDAIAQALAARGYTREPDPLVRVAPRTGRLSGHALGPGAVEQFVEKVPTWGAPFGPCPGFEILNPGQTHPADKELSHG